MTTDFNIFSIRWIHPQCLLNFENMSCPLLDSCQKTFLPEIFESEAVCRHSLFCCMNSDTLIDTFGPWLTMSCQFIWILLCQFVDWKEWSVCQPWYWIILFYFLFSFFFTLCFIDGEGPVPSHLAKQYCKVKYFFSSSHPQFSSCLNFSWLPLS